MSKDLSMLKMRDKHESFHKNKGRLFDLPMKVAIVGRSMLSGKTNAVSNMLLRDEFYKNDFDGSDIYIFSPSVHTDYKLKTLVEEREIEPSNLFDKYDEDTMEALYEVLKDEFNERVNSKEKPTHKLFIFDDLSAEGHLKKHKNGVINKIFSNGRHILINVIVTAQKYSDIPTFARENLSGGMFFGGTDRQLQLITDDHSFIEPSQFKQIYRSITAPKHSFMVINYSNPPESRIMDTEFKPVKI
jgi:hypothetical protein